MWRTIVSNLVGLLMVVPIFGENINNPVYVPKIFFDTVQTQNSIKHYDKATALFLSRISSSLKEKILSFLISKGVDLYLKTGIGSDYTIFYTFPRAYIKQLSLKEETNTGFKYSFGYKISVDLALYIFKSSSNPRLVCYKVFKFERYYPPAGEYLPLYTSLADAIAETFYLKLEPLLQDFLTKEKKKLEYYKNLGK